MLDGFTLLGPTDQPTGATGHHLIIAAQNVATTHRAGRRQGNILGVRRAALWQRPHHLGNHIAGPVHHHGVTNTDIQALNFIDIVQRGVTDDHAPHMHRLQPCHRCQCASAAHLPVHAVEYSKLFLGGKLVGNGPARGAADKTQILLPVETVDLVNHAIDVVIQSIALFQNAVVERQQCINTRTHPHLRVDSQPPAAQGIEHVSVGSRLADTLQLGHGIGIKFQRPAGSDAGVQLAQTAGCRVAGVSKDLLPGLFLASIQRRKTTVGHYHFTAHFQSRR